MQIIQDVILKFNASCEHSEERIDDRIHIYEIRLAHEDGGPDYDSEAFTMQQELADIHCDHNKLALVVKHGSSGTTDNRMDRILLKIDVQQTEQQSACTQVHFATLFADKVAFAFVSSLQNLVLDWFASTHLCHCPSTSLCMQKIDHRCKCY